MQTRSKSGIHNHRLHPSLFLTHSEPKSVKRALESSEWFAAMQEEYTALMRNRTWDLVPLPAEISPSLVREQELELLKL